MRKTVLSFFILLMAWTMVGQVPDMRQRIAEDPDEAGGYFRVYPISDSGKPDPIVPEGYEPFYISHFGRHGCRHHTSPDIYRHCLETLEKAAEEETLTPEGEELFSRLKIICNDVVDRYGDLTPRGKKEHRGIAERMYAHYPQVFQPSENGKPAVIRTRSTVALRCIMSMTAFNERLKEMDPDLEIDYDFSKRYMKELTGIPTAKEADIYSQVRFVVDSLRHSWVDPERFITQLFSDKAFVRKEIHRPEVLMYEMFLVAVIMQDADYLDISLYDFFTDEELYTLWKCLNMQGYCTMAPTTRFGVPIMQGVVPVLEEIISTADQVLDGRLGYAATLRFGHDAALIPMFSLMGLEDIALDLPFDEVAGHWNLTGICPMASNLQLVFFRNKSGKVLVRVLRNERDAALPLEESLSLEGVPFYEWSLLKEYLQMRINCFRPAPEKGTGR